MNNLDRIKKTMEVGQLQWYGKEDVEYLLSIIKQAEKALQYYDTLYANIESNIQHGELITDWLKRQGETARTALKSIQGDET